jgi:hypothetical protein
MQTTEFVNNQGRSYDMGPGDISACYANGFHSRKNSGEEDMRIIVICASSITKQAGGI